MPDASLGVLRHLVGFDTTSRNSNMALIDWAATFAKAHGGVCERFPNADRSKANLLITFGPTNVPGYVLSGHTDVVPVDDQAWSSDPFQLRVENGRAYGRGTADMKGFLACCLAAAPLFSKTDLKAPIHIAMSYDEEIEFPGVLSLLDDLRSRPIKPRFVFVGEATEMEPVIAHKGCGLLRVFVKGFEAHSSLTPQAVSAVEWGARLVTFVRDLADKIAANGPFDHDYDVPFTTMNVGVFTGGSATNVVAGSAYFDIEIRALGSDDPDRYLDAVIHYARDVLEPKMKAVAPEAGFRFEPYPTLLGLETTPEDEIVTLAKHLSGRNTHRKVAFGTEAGMFQKRAGLSTIVLGPGNIEQAHKPDEFIALSELARCDQFLRNLIRHAAG
jgi:acetylornithine deacetylase